MANSEENDPRSLFKKSKRLVTMVMKTKFDFNILFVSSGVTYMCVSKQGSRLIIEKHVKKAYKS